MVHLAVGTRDETDVAAGTSELVEDIGRDAFAAVNAQGIAEVTESDPGKLAALFEAAVDRFLTRTQPWPGDRGIAWHGGLTLDLAEHTSSSSPGACPAGRPSAWA